MMRASLFVLAVSTSACAVDPETDQPVFCFSSCDLTEDPPPSPPQVFTFHVDQGASFAPRLAVGGVIEVDVEARPSQVPQVTTTGTAFTLEVTSAEKHLTKTLVTGTATGEGTISATVPYVDGAGEYRLGVGELATIRAEVDGNAGESLVVFGDIHELTLRLTATDDGLLMDHSLAIDASSDPGFTQPHWDVVGLPATPGDYVLALTRKAGDLHHVGVRVVDQVDAIVADRFDSGKTDGELCVHAELGGELVATNAWVFHGAGFPQGAQHGSCVSWFGARAGATITVELGGATASFVLVP